VENTGNGDTLYYHFIIAFFICQTAGLETTAGISIQRKNTIAKRKSKKKLIIFNFAGRGLYDWLHTLT
jgi:predicted alternative tryptophan synthase beta-subunit